MTTDLLDGHERRQPITPDVFAIVASANGCVDELVRDLVLSCAWRSRASQLRASTGRFDTECVRRHAEQFSVFHVQGVLRSTRRPRCSAILHVESLSETRFDRRVQHFELDAPRRDQCLPELFRRSTASC